MKIAMAVNVLKSVPNERFLRNFIMTIHPQSFYKKNVEQKN